MAKNDQGRRYRNCPECKCYIRADRLNRHRRKVHGWTGERERRGRDGLTNEERLTIFGEQIDETTDPWDRCAAITRAGTQCTRPVAIVLGKAGYCNQHWQSLGTAGRKRGPAKQASRRSTAANASGGRGQARARRRRKKSGVNSRSFD